MSQNYHKSSNDRMHSGLIIIIAAIIQQVGAAVSTRSLSTCRSSGWHLPASAGRARRQMTAICAAGCVQQLTYSLQPTTLASQSFYIVLQSTYHCYLVFCDLTTPNESMPPGPTELRQYYYMAL